MRTSVLITGATGNLGSTVLQRLLAEGYTLLAPASSAVSAQSLHREHVTSIQLDLTDEQAVKAYVQEVAEREDIRAAVLLVGGFAGNSLPDTDGATLRKMISLNFETAFFLVRELLPVFEQRGGGKIILIGARPALQAADGAKLGAYALSKGLVFQLAEMVNAYGKDKGIDATVIVPGVIDTPVNRQTMPDVDPSNWVSPEAIADTIAFLLSDSGRQVRESVVKLYNNS
ncbi:MAG: SDR family NAD(P)-dependent oxidoreductase [Bacteroidetes bacterium]|nr:MAG: SDR family NAD(P)-dependent oxidoreductase [Bacteroidota bacterium]